VKAERYSDLADTDRVRHAGNIAMVRQTVETAIAARAEANNMRSEVVSYVALLNDVTTMLERSFKKIFGESAKLDPWRDERHAVRLLFPNITSECKDAYAKRRALFHAIELHALRMNDVLNMLEPNAPKPAEAFKVVRGLVDDAQRWEAIRTALEWSETTNSDVVTYIKKCVADSAELDTIAAMLPDAPRCG
jgi:hypothetical protein